VKNQYNTEFAGPELVHTVTAAAQSSSPALFVFGLFAAHAATTITALPGEPLPTACCRFGALPSVPATTTEASLASAVKPLSSFAGEGAGGLGVGAETTPRHRRTTRALEMPMVIFNPRVNELLRRPSSKRVRPNGLERPRAVPVSQALPSREIHPGLAVWRRPVS